jgi:hypothetical protein
MAPIAEVRMRRLGKAARLRGLGSQPALAEAPHLSRALTVPTIRDEADRSTS